MEEAYKVIDHYLMIKLPEEIDHRSCREISRRADNLILDKEVEHVVLVRRNSWTVRVSACWRADIKKSLVLEERSMPFMRMIA